MRWLRRKRREAGPSAWPHVTEDGHRVMVQREVAIVIAPGSDVAYPVHIPTAAIAFARPLVGRV